jgi:hypothetical protein
MGTFPHLSDLQTIIDLVLERTHFNHVNQLILVNGRISKRISQLKI